VFSICKLQLEQIPILSKKLLIIASLQPYQHEWIKCWKIYWWRSSRL